MSIYQKRLDELAAVEKRLASRVYSILKEFYPNGVKGGVSVEFKAAKGRLSTIINKVRAHKVLIADRAKANAMHDKMLNKLVVARRLLAEGKMLLAFDIERSWRAETHVARSLTAPARVVRVDDTVGFEPGHTVLFMPFGGRYVIEKVINDKLSVSSRPRGKSGEIVFTTPVSIANGKQGSVFTGRCTTREIGVTTHINGVTTSYNFRSSTASKPNWVGFAFGQTERMTTQEMLNRLIKLAAGAAGYVGHSLLGDFEQIEEEGVQLPKLPTLDTFDLGRILVPEFQDEGGQGANLGAMCARFGVDAPAPHCGGNDTRYNMELLLVMVNEYTKAEEAA